MTAWTDDLDRALIAMARKNMPYSDIGAELGFSKNAIIGRARRLGLPVRRVVRSRKSRAAPPVPQPTPRQIAFASREPLKPEWPQPEIIYGGTTTIDRLAALDVFPGHGNCVFPIGHPGTDGFHFCGTPVADIGSPYCGSCGSKAFTAPPRTGMEAGWSDERKNKHRAMMLARHRA